MSFHEFVRRSQALALMAGIRLPMTKMFNAIALACFDRPYSAVIAAEKAGKLKKKPLPALYAEQAARKLGIEPDVLWQALNAPSIRLTGVDGHQFVTAPTVSGCRRIMMAGSIGSGKTLLIKQIATDYLIRGGRVAIFDYGESFRGLVSHLDGLYHLLDENEGVQWDANDFVVVEQSPLKDRPRQSIAQYERSIESLILNAKAEPLRPWLVVFDEPWFIRNEGFTAERADNLLRRLEAAGAILLFSEQSIQDAYSPRSNNLLQQSDTAWWLLQGADRHLDTGSRKALDSRLGNEGLAMLRGVHVFFGRYSQVLIADKVGVRRGTFSPSKAAQLLYSTRPDDLQEIQKLRAAGTSLDEAINWVLAQRN